ncbi:MAG: phage portal protein, partial [Planctomycetota bacterium]|nr:phage portal protein [Planctomycetota bacterium]
PLYDFLFRNENLNWAEFIESTVGYYALFREVYWVYTDFTAGVAGAGSTIKVVSPEQLKPKLRDGVLVGYELRAGNRILPLYEEDVHVIKNFNPHDPHHGCGPLTAGELAVSTAYQATQYNESTLANGARLSTLLTVPPGTDLKDEERKKIKAEFRAQHAGARNAAKVFLAAGGLDVKTLSQTMADLQMADLSTYSARTVCALFNVPPEVVGLNTEAQYAYGPATQRLILYGIKPILSTIAGHIDAGIVARFNFNKFLKRLKTAPLHRSAVHCGARTPLKARAFYREVRRKAVASGKPIFAWFDIDSHPAIQAMLHERAEKLLKFVEQGVPLNQIIAAGDLPFDESAIPWGNDWWISAGRMPARWVLDGGMDAVLGPDLPESTEEEEEEENKNINLRGESGNIEEKSTRIWQKYAASWQPLEREILSAMRNYLRRQKNEIINRLESELKNIKIRDFRGKADTDAIVARVMFDLKIENNKLKATHRTFYERGVKFGAAQAAAEAAGTGARAVRAAAARRSLTIAARKIQNVNTTTQRRIAKTLADGLDAGESLTKLTKRVSGDFAFSTARARNIARTTTSGAVSTGRFEGLRAVGTERKGWLSARNDAVRDSHRAADSTYSRSAGGIGINDKFRVGSSTLMYPGDPAGDP